MPNVVSLKPTKSQAVQWFKEAGQGKRRLVFTHHVELRMKERKIGRRQVIETLCHGSISEPLHKDVRGDWRCDVSWFYAGLRLTVGIVFKTAPNGELVVVATVFEG